MTNPPPSQPEQSARSSAPESPGGQAQIAAPNGDQPQNADKPPAAEEKAPAPNGSAPPDARPPVPAPDGAKAASPNGGAPAAEDKAAAHGAAPADAAKPPDAKADDANAPAIPAQLPHFQADEDQAPAAPPQEDPLQKLEQQRKKQATPTADTWRDAVAASTYSTDQSGGINFGVGSTIGSIGTAIGANQIHGGVHNYYSAGSQAKRSLKPQPVQFNRKKLQDIFVEPAAYQAARRLLAQEHLVVLRGPLYSGKWTTGLYLLQARHGDDVDSIAPHVTGEDFSSLALTPGRAYIVDNVNATSLPSITSSALHQLADSLKAIGSHCVLLVDSADPLKNRIDEYLVAVDPISEPIAIQMLEKHVLWPLKQTTLAALAQDLCQKSEVRAVLVDRTPREVVALAELLGEVARGKFDLDEALKRFKQSVDYAANWFADHTKTEQRTYLLAVAVLNGAECQQVLDAQHELFKLLAHTTKDAAPKRAPVFDPRRSEWIGECRARMVNGSKTSAFGQSLVRRVVLRDPQLRDELLSYVWQEYDQLHPALLLWLNDLGRHADAAVRNGAATAAGILAKLDLEHVCREVLLPWASDEHPEPRFAAALALAVLAKDDDFVWDALRLTQALGRSESEQCMLAAATAYGGVVGARFPEEALEDLATMARRDSVDLGVEVFQSVVNLFNIGYVGRVFVALEKWTDDPEPTNLSITGANIFLNMTDIPFAGKNNKTLPFMLALAQAAPMFNDMIMKLWRRLLNRSWARRATLDALHDWIAQAESQPHMYPYVEQMVRDLLKQATARERERMFFYLRQWDQQIARRKTFSAAGRILAAVVSAP